MFAKAHRRIIPSHILSTKVPIPQFKVMVLETGVKLLATTTVAKGPDF